MQCTIYNLRRPVRRAAGQGLVEYALAIGLIALVLFAVVTTLGGSVRGLYQRIGNAINAV